MKAWFISDIHLKDIRERNSEELLRFLHFVSNDTKTTHLFLLGDIFDLWVGHSKLFHTKFAPLVDLIIKIKRQGIEVIYFEGNHDLHIEKFWQEKFQIPVLVERKIYQLGNLKVQVEHGDYINPDDLAYMRYLGVIRSLPMKIFAQTMPGKFFERLGTWASRVSRETSYTYRKDSENLLRERIRTFAKTQAQISDFDYLIAGHMHLRDEYQFQAGGKSVISINLGSWFDEPKAFCIEDGKGQWVTIADLFAVGK